tara:strand:+ start:2172 stop:3698 length:1527 start_codon:yes stop_codon:yes gene_type:complete
MTYSESNYLGSAIGSNLQAPFTFTYTDVNEIRVDITVGGTTTTYNSTSNPAGFTITSPEQFVTLSNAPGASDEIRVYRLTYLDEPYAQFTAGAVISADALNTNNSQVLHASQEIRYIGNTATTTGKQALADAATAIATANSATATANTADTNASAAVATANTANTNSTNAVNTANTADTNASTALSTANTALTNSQTAISTSNTADYNASVALSNSTEPDGAGGVRSAITVANTALDNSRRATSSGAFETAIELSETAYVTAYNALAAVAAAIDFDPVNNVAAIPSVNANTQALYIEVKDATGIESFTPLTGVPTGFVGDSGLTVRISYDPALSTWEWVQYFANDANNRFVRKAGDTFTGGMTFSNNAQFDSTAEFNSTANLYGTTKALEFELLGNPTTSSSGYLKFNCENNSHAITLKGPPHSAGASYTLTLPNALPTLNGQVLVSDLSGNTSFETIDAAYVETPQTITISKTVGANINAAMIGPTVSIASGTTITVSQNAYLTVLS